MENKELINLHETLFHFLLNYRNTAKNVDSPTFLFRPLSDIEALNQGRWFYDSPEKGWVNLYLSENKRGRSRVYNNNVQFSVSVSRKWKIDLNFQPIYNYDAFFNNLINSFYSISINKPRIQNSIVSPFNNKQITITPLEQNYRVGLPEAIDLFYQFVAKQEYFNGEMPFSLISNNYFEKSLSKINELRNEYQLKQVYLTDFQIKKYQGINETSLSKLADKPTWIFVTGENGYGKTSLLRALAIGLYGDAEDTIIPRNTETEITLSYTQRFSNAEILVENNIEQPLFFRHLPVLATYGPSRLELQAQDSHGQQIRNSTATYSLFHTDGVLKNIESELLISFYDAPQKFKALCAMLTELIPSLDRIELDKKNRKILYYEKAQSGDKSKTFEAISFEQLASGIKSLIAIVGDIYLRLSEAIQKFNPDYTDNKSLLLFDNFSWSNSPKDLLGIVIIDELDLHLHPKWQRLLPSLLTKVFPNVQFIASTHSPIPLLGAPPNSVFLKVSRSYENGITVQRLESLEKEISNLLPNAILTSPIFDMEELFPLTHQDNVPIETANDYRQILEDNALKQELLDLAKKFKFPENILKPDYDKGK